MFLKAALLDERLELHDALGEPGETLAALGARPLRVVLLSLLRSHCRFSFWTDLGQLLTTCVNCSPDLVPGQPAEPRARGCAAEEKAEGDDGDPLHFSPISFLARAFEENGPMRYPYLWPNSSSSLSLEVEVEKISLS